MSGFKDHLKAAIVVGLLFTTITIQWLVARRILVSQEQRILYIVLALGGVVIFGILLDIDVWSSIPRRVLGKGLIGLSVAIPLYLLISDPSRLHVLGAWVVPVLGLDNIRIEIIGAGVALALGLVISRAIGYGLDELTSHRGLLHSKEFVLGCGALAFLGLWYWGALPLIAVALSAVAVSLGGFVHLSLDSLN